MIHRSSKIGICKGNPSKRSVPQNLAGCGPAIAAKEKPGLRTEIGVPPAVEDDPGDIPPRVKARAVKHLSKLFAEPPLIVLERGPDQLGASPMSLFFGGIS